MPFIPYRWLCVIFVPIMLFVLVTAMGDTVELAIRLWWVSAPVLLLLGWLFWRWLDPAKTAAKLAEKLAVTVFLVTACVLAIGVAILVGWKVAVALGWTWILLGPFLLIFGGVLAKSVFDDRRAKRKARRDRGEGPVEPLVK